MNLSEDEEDPSEAQFSEQTERPDVHQLPRSASPLLSSVSIKSEESFEFHRPLFSEGSMTSELGRKRKRDTSPGPSCVSVKSDDSMKFNLSAFSDDSDPFTGEINEPVPSVKYRVTHNKKQNTESAKQKLKQIVETDYLHQDSHQPVDATFQKVKDRHKTFMKNKYESLFEGIRQEENKTLLNSIYTQLYIIEGEKEGVNEEHEVLQMEKNKTQPSQDTPIYCNDIFKASPEPGCEEKDTIKTVLTIGIAGIGKTVSVQKFILDWAEGKANQDVDFMFVLPFREMNLIKDHQYSLHRLLLDFHPELHNLDSKIYGELKLVFIFDGLDENRIPQIFSNSHKVSDVTEPSSVDVLMSNLLKGDLLPSAHIWITTRPAAANQIPSNYINRVTEIQGFNDPQKEEYFRKRISDEHQAGRMISHIRKTRSLHIMCHIPVFCWISSTVLQKLLENLSTEIPQTLTEMYINFLIIQINMRNQKSEERDPEKLLQSNREVILKLAELAFKQLIKHNVMFYEEDLIESGIDVTDASAYSGICTEIFKEESVIHQRKVYCFIHLSFQEFLAAFYVFYFYIIKNDNTLHYLDQVHNLHRHTVDDALQYENGHLDLFLRFLLGISLESNQRLLLQLLTHTEGSSESIRKTSEYIKDIIRAEKNLSTERSINLFLCLLEMKDRTLYTEIQEFMKSDTHSEKKLTPAQCSAITCMLQMSDEVLDELDLKKYNTSDDGRRRLIPAVSNFRKVLLADCNLIGHSYEIVVSALLSLNSPLRELDLSNNDLEDSGVKMLSDALKSPNCNLEILRISGCMVTEVGCYYLASSLSSASRLKELDLSYNHPGDSGVKLLSERLNDPNCALEKLNVDHNEAFRITPGLQKYFCDLTLDPNTTHNSLLMAESRMVTHVKEDQSYPEHPERFEHYEQVMCQESLTGRCYWETEFNGNGHVAVTYKKVSRKEGIDCLFGLNEHSWCLFWINSGKVCTAWHDNKNTDVSVPSQTKRVGAYLDWSAGTLSFYSVSDTHTLTHLYTFNTTFTEPLYAGFRLYPRASVSLCHPA